VAVTILRGRVRTGRGDFGKWIGRLQSHYREKTGLSLYPGTLNVELEAPLRERFGLQDGDWVEIEVPEEAK